MARKITYNNFEIFLVVFMRNISTNHAITYTNFMLLRYFILTLSKNRISTLNLHEHVIYPDIYQYGTVVLDETTGSDPKKI